VGARVGVRVGVWVKVQLQIRHLHPHPPESGCGWGGGGVRVCLEYSTTPTPATDFLFICMFLIFGVSPACYNQVKISERDFQYIVNSLEMKYKMNYDDAKSCVLEFEHFYTGINYKVLIVY
jgi:hypothetical protein